MDRPPVGDDLNAGTTRTRWQRWADRLAGYAWLVLLTAVTLALLGGIIGAVTWQPDANPVPARVDECADPPCFELGGVPGIQDLPVVLPALGYVLAIALGLPSLLTGTGDCIRGRWAVGSRRLLPFIGPVLILVGVEIVPHVVSPCTLAQVLGSDELPGICERAEHGVDIKDRWHALDHALVGALPLAALYRLALRRWHPAVSRGRGDPA